MKINYRPEIDGLRGIAIIFIILGHLNSLDFVTGGVNFFFRYKWLFNNSHCFKIRFKGFKFL